MFKNRYTLTIFHATIAIILNGLVVSLKIQSNASANPAKLGMLTIRKGLSTDDIQGVQGSVPFQNLAGVVAKIRAAYPKNFAPATIVNVGASNKNGDPIYSMELHKMFKSGYKIIGYEGDPKFAEEVRKKKHDVVLREMYVNTTNIVTDLTSQKIDKEFAILKTDIDSVDGPILDSVLQNYQPSIVYSEIMWDFPPPVEFSLVMPGLRFSPGSRGCFGMSIQMADHILRRNGYRLIEAAHANIIAVHESLSHLFSDRPQDPWFWYQATKSAFYHTHWIGGTPLNEVKGKNLGIYEELRETDGNDGFAKPLVAIRTMDKVMQKIAEHVVSACGGDHAAKWLLAVGDRCCAPQWGNLTNCVCGF